MHTRPGGAPGRVPRPAAEEGGPPRGWGIGRVGRFMPTHPALSHQPRPQPLTATVIFFGWASGFLGTWTVSTPSAASAVTFPTSAAGGSGIDR